MNWSVSKQSIKEYKQLGIGLFCNIFMQKTAIKTTNDCNVSIKLLNTWEFCILKNNNNTHSTQF